MYSTTNIKMFLLTVFIFAVLSNEVFSVEEFICEYQTLNIECPEHQFLRIYNAIYGRNNDTICSNSNPDQSTNCSSPNATEIVKERCDGKENCTLSVSNEVFGDPCVNTVKYLQLNYACLPRQGPGPIIIPCGVNEERRCENECYRETCNTEALPSGCNGNSTRNCTFRCVCQRGYLRDPKGNCVRCDKCPPVKEYICENDKLNIDCPLFTVVHINSANYGRQNSSICAKKGLDQNVHCSSNVTDIVRKQCDADRGNNCTLLVSNKLFKDPCVGTYKYLEISYSCKKVSHPPPIWTRPPHFTCRPDEEFGWFNSCFRQCQPSLFCLLPGKICVCKKGLKRDSKTKRCVPEKHCPLPGKECDTHEVYSECEAGCQKTCENRDHLKCEKSCVPGYVCAQNYVRDPETRRCMSIDKCPKRT